MRCGYVEAQHCQLIQYGDEQVMSDIHELRSGESGSVEVYGWPGSGWLRIGFICRRETPGPSRAVRRVDSKSAWPGQCKRARPIAH